MIARLRFLTFICVLTFSTLLHAQGLTTAPIDQALGGRAKKRGMFTESVSPGPISTFP